jgi:hypothetical protein
VHIRIYRYWIFSGCICLCALDIVVGRFVWRLVGPSRWANRWDCYAGGGSYRGPDGRRIAFSTGVEIGQMNPEDTGQTVSYLCRFHVDDLCFTPDGAHLVFAEFPDTHCPARIRVLDLNALTVETAPDIK